MGGTVIFVQLQIPQWLVFKKIILLGVDHSMVFDDKRVYGGVYLNDNETKRIHFSDKYISSKHSDILATENAFRLAKKQMEKDSIELYNATPNTKLDIIDKKKINSL